MGIRCVAIAVFLLASGFPLVAEVLKPETAVAFDHYVQLSEERMTREIAAGQFLRVDSFMPQARSDELTRLERGDIIVERMQTLDQGREVRVPGGMVHHWAGTVFIPGASLSQTLTFLQNYNNQYKFYGPDVQRSKLIQRNGDEFRVFLRLKKHEVITVILNTEYDVKYSVLGPDKATSYSRSTRIAEVEHAGEASESEKPVGNDDGFLWRLNSYWRFLQRGGGVYVQLDAISLTRDIPSGLSWLIGPFVTSIPKESLEFTLRHTRDALKQ